MYLKRISLITSPLQTNEENEFIYLLKLEFSKVFQIWLSNKWFKSKFSKKNQDRFFLFCLDIFFSFKTVGTGQCRRKHENCFYINCGNTSFLLTIGGDFNKRNQLSLKQRCFETLINISVSKYWLLLGTLAGTGSVKNLYLINKFYTLCFWWRPYHNILDTYPIPDTALLPKTIISKD